VSTPDTLLNEWLMHLTNLNVMMRLETKWRNEERKRRRGVVKEAKRN